MDLGLEENLTSNLRPDAEGALREASTMLLPGNPVATATWLARVWLKKR